MNGWVNAGNVGENNVSMNRKSKDVLKGYHEQRLRVGEYSFTPPSCQILSCVSCSALLQNPRAKVSTPSSVQPYPTYRP